MDGRDRNKEGGSMTLHEEGICSSFTRLAGSEMAKTIRREQIRLFNNGGNFKTTECTELAESSVPETHGVFRGTWLTFIGIVC